MKVKKCNVVKYLIIVLILLVSDLKADDYVRKIILIKENVMQDTVFASSIFNGLHTITKDYVIFQELVFKEDEPLDYFTIYESERNLRATGLFTYVKIEVDSVGSNFVDVIVKTKEKFSTQPSFLYGAEGGAMSIGGKLNETNLLGHNWQLDLEYLYLTENNIGDQVRFMLNKQRIFGLNADVYSSITANQFKTNQEYQISKPFRNYYDKHSWNLNVINKFGQDFIYQRRSLFRETNNFDLLQTKHIELNASYHHGWASDDRVFAGFNFSYNDIERGNPELRRAFDNTGSILAHFSSVSQDFVKTNKLDDYKDEDLVLGGYGSAILGRTFKTDETGDEVWYLGGRGERSFLFDDLYIYLSIEGGSGFIYSRAKYTYQEFQGIFNYFLNDNSNLILRLKQQTAWSWDKHRQLILDPMWGLRGYSINQFAGDNRVISNLEYRYFPGWELWIFKLSGVAFWDIGGVWDQDQGFRNSRYYNGAGLGIRFHNNISIGDGSILRVDFAWNFDENRFGGIIFTSEQLFNAFQNHNFRLPSIFGREFNEQ